MFRRPLFSAARRLLCNAAPFRDPNPHAARAQALLANMSPSAPDTAAVADALPLARRAVEAGSPRGQTVLASLMQEGLGVPRDAAEARRLFRAAAAAGDPVAMCSLGALLVKDAAAAANGDDAEELVATGEAVAVHEATGERRGVFSLRRADGSELGAGGSSSSEDAPTPAELVRRVRKARRRAGFTDDQALEFESARQVQADRIAAATRQEGLDWLRRAADAGNDTAMVMLGNALVEGGDAAAAVEHYQRAVAATRNPSAYFNLAQLYTHDFQGVERDEKAALKALGMAAQLGSVDAQVEMIQVYLRGSEVVKADEGSARQFAELAYEQGHPAGAYELALMRRDGLAGFEKSNGAFLRLLKESTDREYAPALALMADMHYKSAPGVESDYAKALEYFTRAGRAGNSDALCSAGAMHFRGFGTPVDRHKALLLYQDAAVAGNVQAFRNIANMYMNGEGVEVNKKLAEHFFHTANQIEEDELKAKERSFDPTIRTADAPKHPMEDIPRLEEMMTEKDAAVEESGQSESTKRE